MPTKNNHGLISELARVSIPDVLFHYTTSAGMVGILETGNIWTTKIQYTNDHTELRLALNYIRNEIDFQRQGIGKTRTDEELEGMCRALDGVQTVNVGVASFTEIGDQLGQWRGYCEIGDGYSLGFDAAKLQDKLRKRYSYHLFPCIYEVEQHKRLAKELIDHYPTKHLLDIAKRARHASRGDPYDFEIAFSSAIVFFAPLIKTENFKEEKEWRLISPILSYAEAHFRRGNHSLIPYWEFDLDLENTLKQIVVGPTPEPALSSLAVRGLLLKKSLLGFSQEVEISPSKIPIREI
ncbi:MAG TPA: DUF2971 domain-containing protein [Anaerolineales bacterium]|nr:DUF2971 domain-containing protein [Anaerolineales bacterium]